MFVTLVHCQVKPEHAEAFEDAGALGRLEGFASLGGAAFYGLPPHDETVTLERRPWTAPAEYPFGDDTIVPLRAGEPMRWRLAGNPSFRGVS